MRDFLTTLLKVCSVIVGIFLLCFIVEHEDYGAPVVIIFAIAMIIGPLCSGSDY